MQLLPLLSAVELADHPRYVKTGFAIRGHTVVLVDRSRSGVISRQRQREMIVIPQQERIQVSCSTLDVLVCTEAVGYA
jgi:hypothetical protein